MIGNELPVHLFEAGEAIIRGKAFGVKDTLLRSGEVSPYYVNMRKIRSSRVHSDVVVGAMLEAIDGLEFRPDFVADVPTSMTPLVTLLSYHTHIPHITPRLDQKAYGSGDPIDGVWTPGTRGVLWEDTATTGGSIINGAEVLKNEGLSFIPYLVVDREQGGIENIKAAGYPDVKALLTVTQLLRLGHFIGEFNDEELARSFAYLKTKQDAISDRR